jgi:hypothetical protein
VLCDRDLKLKSGCKGKVDLETLSHITPLCIAICGKKLRANIQTEGRKSEEKDIRCTKFVSNSEKSREFSFPDHRTGLQLTKNNLICQLLFFS